MIASKEFDKHERLVEIAVGRRRLSGILNVPYGAEGVAVFAHGSGSGRFSPRNQAVATNLQLGGTATLLLDLLDEDEAGKPDCVFDIELLASRLLAAIGWLREDRICHDLFVGLFGASTGAAAAVIAAARQPSAVAAVVSRGGRPDLARLYLAQVRAPTMFIVGGDDHPVRQMNEEAYDLLACPKKLVIIAGATHLFEEPGALEEVALFAGEWFSRYLTPAAFAVVGGEEYQHVPKS